MNICFCSTGLVTSNIYFFQSIRLNTNRFFSTKKFTLQHKFACLYFRLQDKQRKLLEKPRKSEFFA